MFKILPNDKNVYFKILDATAPAYNGSIHSAIEMRPKDLTSDFILITILVWERKPKFKFLDCVRIPTSNSTFAQIYTSNLC